MYTMYLHTADVEADALSLYDKYVSYTSVHHQADIKRLLNQSGVLERIQRDTDIIEADGQNDILIRCFDCCQQRVVSLMNDRWLIYI